MWAILGFLSLSAALVGITFRVFCKHADKKEL